MDTIYLTDIETTCLLGIYEHEKISKQKIVIDLALELDLKEAGLSDNFEHTVCYGEVSKLVQELANSKGFELIEHLCELSCKTLLERFERLQGVEIRIYKPEIKEEGFSGNASVKITRKRS